MVNEYIWETSSNMYIQDLKFEVVIEKLIPGFAKIIENYRPNKGFHEITLFIVSLCLNNVTKTIYPKKNLIFGVNKTHAYIYIIRKTRIFSSIFHFLFNLSFIQVTHHYHKEKGKKKKTLPLVIQEFLQRYQ